MVEKARKNIAKANKLVNQVRELEEDIPLHLAYK